MAVKHKKGSSDVQLPLQLSLEKVILDKFSDFLALFYMTIGIQLRNQVKWSADVCSKLSLKTR